MPDTPTNPDNLKKREHWLFQLSGLQADVNSLKTGLAIVLSQEFSRQLLFRMEHFQSVLLNHDATIALLRHELSQEAAPEKQVTVVEPPAAPNKWEHFDKDVSLLKHAVVALKKQFDEYANTFKS